MQGQFLFVCLHETFRFAAGGNIYIIIYSGKFQADWKLVDIERFTWHLWHFWSSCHKQISIEAICYPVINGWDLHEYKTFILTNDEYSFRPEYQKHDSSWIDR